MFVLNSKIDPFNNTHNKEISKNTRIMNCDCRKYDKLYFKNSMQPGGTSYGGYIGRSYDQVRPNLSPFPSTQVPNSPLTDPAAFQKNRNRVVTNGAGGGGAGQPGTLGTLGRLRQSKLILITPDMVMIRSITIIVKMIKIMLWLIIRLRMA